LRKRSSVAPWQTRILTDSGACMPLRGVPEVENVVAMDGWFRGKPVVSVAVHRQSMIGTASIAEPLGAG